MNDELLSIGEAAEILGVSLMTLRRWDEQGVLSAVRPTPSSHRYYTKSSLEAFMQPALIDPLDWASSEEIQTPHKDIYCANSSIFQARLQRLERELSKDLDPSMTALVVAIVGELGGNSFDHNLGNWPDIPGLVMIHSSSKRCIELADRGRGVLATLKRSRPSLDNDLDALKTAFTEVVSGRAPESRGNGLKFVRRIVSRYPLALRFRSGNAELSISREADSIATHETSSSFHGSYVHLQF